MSVSSPYIVRAGDVPAYSPAGHTGTRNYRLVAPGVNGARFMEVVLGHWDSWEDDAIVADKTTGLYAHPEKVHRLDHRAKCAIKEWTSLTSK